MAIDISKLAVTSRDYSTIYDQLINAIPALTKKWNSTDETDPGIVLVKLMSMLGDMLSYNHDKAVLELYPSSVTQRKNAIQVFKLAGYKMRWYRSAACKMEIQNISPGPAIMPKYTTFNNVDKSIVYTYIGKDLTLESDLTNGGMIYTVDLIEGVPITPTRLNNRYLAKGDGTENWHDIYDYNIQNADIVNSRIYLTDTNIDELSVTLIDNDGDEWTQVDNIESLMENGKYFELSVDSNDRCYIKLASSWDRITSTKLKFKLFYILTSGSSGNILDGVLTNTQNIFDQSIFQNSGYTVFSDISSQMILRNARSTLGYDPETADEAREQFAKYVGTYDTLITVDDFTKAIKRLDGVANCVCTDKFSDYDSGLPANVIRIYITRTESYEDYDVDTYKAYIASKLSNLKMMPIEIEIFVDEETIDETVFFYYKNELDEQLVERFEIVSEEDMVDTDMGYLVVDNTSHFVWIDDFNNAQYLQNTKYRIYGGYQYADVGDYESLIDFDGREVLHMTKNQAIDYYYWTPTGTIYTKEPVTLDAAQDLLVKINNYLTTTYNVNNNEYNKELTYIDVINTIMSIDPIINYVDLDQIKYTVNVSVFGQQGSENAYTINKRDVVGKYTTKLSYVSESLTNPLANNSVDYFIIDDQTKIAFESITDNIDTIDVYNYKPGDVSRSSYSDENLVYTVTNYLETNEKQIHVYLKNDESLKDSLYIHRPIKKGSIIIRVGNLESLIFDNRSGQLESQNVYFTEGYIDYDTGTLELNFSEIRTGEISVSYRLNKNGIVRYSSFSANNFTISDDSLKEG